MLSIIKEFLKYPRNLSFNHKSAQAYELAFAKRHIRDEYHNVLACDPWPSDFVPLTSFLDKWCMEIGSGPYGTLSRCPQLSPRIIIDPLLSHYRLLQLRYHGQTLFVPANDLNLHPVNAEPLIPAYVGQIDGCIICRNCIDHAEDPLQILANIALYAAPGCYIYLWFDCWHDKPDAGHRSITRSTEALDALVRGLGFKILNPLVKQRLNYPHLQEYGICAVKE